jgi:MFS family permease
MSTIAIHAFDELVLTIALPDISSKLGLENLYGFTFATYILFAIGGMRVSGSYIDAFGPRRVMNTGLVIFLTGTVLSTVSWGPYSFISSRALQGLGGGICITTAFALINLASENTQRRKLITGIDVAWVIPSLAAPIIGGLLVDYISWRAIFALQIPILILVIGLFSSQLEPYDKHNAKPSYKVSLDAIGISLGTGFTLYLLSLKPGPIWILVVASTLLSVSCFNRAMPEKWWHANTMLTLPLVVGLLGFTAFYGMEAFQPLYLIHSLNLSTTEAGIIVTFASFSWLAASHWAVRLYERYPPIRIMLAGSITLLLGILGLGGVVLFDLPTYLLYLGWVISGFGMGFIFNSIRTTAMEHAPKGKEGFVSTSITLSINMGIAFSAGIGGILKNHTYQSDTDLKSLILLISLSGLLFCTINIFTIYFRYRQNRAFSKNGVVE